MTDSLRAFLETAPKDWLVRTLYDLVMDTVDREIREAGPATSGLDTEQTKAVVMRRMNERLRRTLGPKSP